MISGTILGRSRRSNSEVRVAGLRELLDGLSKLPFELGKGAIYSALGGAGAIVRKEAQARVPVLSGSDPAVAAGRRKPGTLKRAIRVSRSKINRGQNGRFEVIVRVKPLKGKQVAKFKQSSGLKAAMNPDDPYYWWWVEFGTSKMAARPFLRPAFEQTKSAQLDAMRKRMRAGLDRAARKIAAKVDRAAA
jgi:HK97 gp10 family phage protein